MTAARAGKRSAIARAAFSPGSSNELEAPAGSASRPSPECMATSVTSGFSASSAARARRTASSGASQERPAKFSGFSHCGTAGVVRPMTATFTPATVFTR